MSQLAEAQTSTVRRTPVDTSRSNNQSRRLLYSNWHDRYTNRYITLPSRSSLYLRDPKNISNEFWMDTTKRVSIYERVGNKKKPYVSYRDPLSMTYEEFRKLQDERVMQNIWREYGAKQDGKGIFGAKGLIPKLELPPALDRIFGGGGFDFKPNGYVLLDFGVLYTRRDDPQVPINMRRRYMFTFDPQTNINFNGKIGDNLGLLTNFDTKSSFNFENQLKLDYRPGNLKPNLPNTSNLNRMGQGVGQNMGVNQGMGANQGMGLGQGMSMGTESYIPENESIIQGVQAGNINWQLPSQLIPGVQNLFGAKVDLRFGRLSTTLVASQQRSKQQCITLKGGAQNKGFEIRADAYDENRHFFLSYFFRENYERWLNNLPMIMSGITITRLEVYVTNRSNNTETLRNVVALSDIGESKPANTTNAAMQPIIAGQPVNNATNGLFSKISKDDIVRQVDKTTDALNNTYTLKRGTEYDIIRGARRLTDREYKFNTQLGYVSLLTPLRNDEVLAVAYEYTLNGRKYTVGELTEDYQSRKADEVLVLKLLKSSSIRNSTRHPLWDLMMKNIYSLNSFQISKQNFQLRVIYKDDFSGIDNPHLQEGRKLANVPLLRVMGLDKLNPVGDPVKDSQGRFIGDGNFDFIEGITIDQQLGRVIFPVLEPFGASLAKNFDADEEALRNKYVFNELYRTTQIDAQQITEKNKFFLKGSFQGASGGTMVQLPFGVAEKSIIIRAGGVQLQQGVDYMVEGQSGGVRIMNESIINSGRDIEVCYEQPDLFQNQIRTLLGTRLSYAVSRNLQVGMTAMRLRETPPGFLSRANIGNDPVSNSIIGADINFRKESPLLTRILDKLPLIQTKETSSVQFQGEVAQSFAGLHPQVRNRIVIDDFEAARTQFDLTRQPTRWRLGGTPQDSKFLQGTLANPLEYAYNRAKISAYTIDISFAPNASVGSRQPVSNITKEDLRNVNESLFTPQDIFKGRSAYLVNMPESILDIAYFPQERGPYNFNPNLDANGFLPNPRNNFGAITRAINADPDFDNVNVEIAEFWLMDPFKDVVKDGVRNARNTKGGKLLINLGDISEDVMKNGRFDFENGLPLDSIRTAANGSRAANVAQTDWGYTTRQQYVINAFSNQPGARQKQDIGLDGLNNVQEREFFNKYLQSLPSNLSAEVRKKIEKDPSGDDFEFYLSPQADSANKKIVERYKNYMGMEGNTPELQTNNNFITAATNVPDAEDLNLDNTINDQEAYYEYEIDLKDGALKVGNQYIVDKVTAQNTEGATVDWYLFRVPIREYTRKVGDINGFKSIRFVRMYLTDWEEPVVLRFAQLQLVATQYRKFTGDLTARGLQEVPEPYDAQFKIATVSVEENSSQSVTANNKRQIYAVPPGWQRDIDFTSLNQRQLNEQAMSLCVTNLRDGDSRAAFKNIPSTNLLFRKRIKMYVHMHNDEEKNGEVSAFLRLGTDVTENYYEVEIRNLKATPFNNGNPDLVWPQQNEIDIATQWLIDAKSERDRQTTPSFSIPYSITRQDELGREYIITVSGRPDLSNVMILMMGLRNPRFEQGDDHLPKSFCIWVDELHVQGFENQSGTAAIARADIKLADIATIQVAGKITTLGFGGVQQKPSDRSRDLTREFSLSSAIALDKFLAEKWGFKIPLYINYDLRNVTPHFNPFDPDMPLQTALANLERDPFKQQQLEYAATEKMERKGFNFSNVRKMKMNPNAKRHFWDFENLSFTYAFNQQTRRNSTTADFEQRQYRAGIIYQYGFPQKIWQPFAKAKNFDRPYLELLKDFNVSLLPSQVAIRFEVDRNFIRTLYRSSDLTEAGQAPFFEKYFWFNRSYDLNWNLTKNINLTYSSKANAIIDEPQGNIDTEQKKDSLWRNFRSFGRMKNFNQDIRITYRLPLDKIPLLDWMTADYTHRINYQYQANSLGISDTNNVSFGNIIRNARDRSIQGKVDFVKLYNKIRYLRFANNPSPPRKNFARSPGDDEEISREPNKVLKNITRLLMAVRGIDVTYSQEETTTLPGYIYDRAFDNSSNTKGLLWSFIAGNQIRDFNKQFANKEKISRSTMLNLPFMQTINKTFRATTRIQPFKDFNIQLQANLTRGDQYQEFYRPETKDGNFIEQSPVRNGNFQMSFMSFRTSFSKIREDNTSPVFEQFKAYRGVVKDILNRTITGTGEYQENSQDVLIMAFFAAYNGKDPTKLSFNKVPFLKVPFPNWRVDYSGLSQLPGFKKIFSSFSIEHSYQSTYSVGNFTSSLDYEALRVNLAVKNYPVAILPNANGTGLVPIFVMSTISMYERFSPLIGIRARTQNRIDFNFNYNQSRNIALNLGNAIVAENFNRDITASIGFTRNNVRLPFKVNGENKKLKNDLQFRFTMSIIQMRDIQHNFDEPPTARQGYYTFRVNPQINYTVSKLWNIQLYFDHNFNKPYVTNVYYQANSRGGVQIRFNIAEL